MISLQPIPYQGSKRKLSKEILACFPENAERLVEPFCGSAAISLAAASEGIIKEFWLNDSFEPLISLWDIIINKPEYVIEQYTKLWENQQNNPKEFFLKKRDEFNLTHDPTILLYLLVRSAKNAVRFNSSGGYNQSPDNRRLGRTPLKMKEQIELTSCLLKGKTKLTSLDYSKVLSNLNSDDLIYMDPPYQGTSLGKNSRYYENLDYERFVKNLELLNDNEHKFLVSFDGSLGNKKYGEDLPPHLELFKKEIFAGTSAQSTLNGKKEETIESLYISQFI